MGEDLGKLILRLTLGILILLHGLSKLKGGVGFLEPMVHGLGLPAWVSYGVFIGEIAGPVMVILGLFARTGAFVIFVNMIFAVILFHPHGFFALNKEGGYVLELEAIYLFAALALVFMNPGRYALMKRY